MRVKADEQARKPRPVIFGVRSNPSSQKKALFTTKQVCRIQKAAAVTGPGYEADCKI